VADQITLGKRMKIVRILGWSLWFLGVLYAILGIANGQKITSATFRDATIQKHDLWHDGAVSKVQARAAMFEMNDQYVAYAQRIYWTTVALFGIGTLMLVVEKRRPNKPVQHNAGSRPPPTDFSAPETPSSLGPRG